MNRIGAEAFATFALVLIGTGAILVDAAYGGQITHVGVSLAFGAIVMVMIYAVGDVSGAHLNPAVTLAFALAGRFPWRRVPGYVLAQCGGALAASMLLALCFGSATGLGATVPSGSLAQAIGVEIVLTAILMFVILHVSTNAKEVGLMAGAAIGATVAVAALVGGPVTGASMNPARSIGPAVASGQLASLWVYLVAPTVGAASAVIFCRCTRGSDCCRSELSSPVSEAST